MASGVSPPICRPPKVIDPAEGCSAPETQLKAVVFPDPFGPMSPRISPSFTSNDTSFSAVNPPNLFVNPRIVSMVLKPTNTHTRAQPTSEC